MSMSVAKDGTPKRTGRRARTCMLSLRGSVELMLNTGAAVDKTWRLRNRCSYTDNVEHKDDRSVTVERWSRSKHDGCAALAGVLVRRKRCLLNVEVRAFSVLKVLVSCTTTVNSDSANAGKSRLNEVDRDVSQMEGVVDLCSRSTLAVTCRQQQHKVR
jgi:hypothetical protein